MGALRVCSCAGFGWQGRWGGASIQLEWQRPAPRQHGSGQNRSENPSLGWLAIESPFSNPAIDPLQPQHHPLTLLAWALQLPEVIAHSLMTQFVSSPFALIATRHLGGQAELAVFFVLGLVALVNWVVSQPVTL